MRTHVINRLSHKWYQVLLVVTFMFISNFGYSQGHETFDNIPTNSSTSYLERVWTSNGITWTCTKGRTSGTINGKALMFASGNYELNSSSISGGIGSLTFKYKKGYSNPGTLELYINDVKYGETVNVLTSTKTFVANNINISEASSIKIKATGRSLIDDIEWTAYSGGPSKPSVTLETNMNEGTEADETEITLTARASEALSSDQTVDIVVTGVDATDYSLNNTTLTIPSGSDNATATFKILNDTDEEGAETATLTLNNPSDGIVLGSPKTLDIAINDDDLVVLQEFTVNDIKTWSGSSTYTSGEALKFGSSSKIGTRTSGSLNHTGSINILIDAEHYDSNEKVLILSYNGDERTINLDGRAIHKESFIAVDGGTITIKSQSGGKRFLVYGLKITRGEAPTTPLVSISSDVNEGSEADQTVITITATTSETLTSEQTVDLSVSGVDATDYSLNKTTITIPNGANSSTATFTILNDSDEEGNETATISLSNPSSGLTIGAPSSLDITINDDDLVSHAGTKDDPYSIAEVIALPSGNGPFYAKGYIISGFNGTNALKVADNSTETELNNCIYLKLGTTPKPTWNASDNPDVVGKQIVFNGKRDSYSSHQSVESNTEVEEFGGTTPTKPTVTLSSNVSSGTEDDATIITITATASENVSVNETITITTSGSGITTDDYTFSGTITILSGQSTGNTTFTIVDDSNYEGTETASLEITDVGSNLAIGSPKSVDITITDNDTPSLPFDNIIISQVYESGGSKYIEITNANVSSHDFSINPVTIKVWGNKDDMSTVTDKVFLISTGTLNSGESLLYRNSSASAPIYASTSATDANIVCSQFNGKGTSSGAFDIIALYSGDVALDVFMPSNYEDDTWVRNSSIKVASPVFSDSEWTQHQSLSTANDASSNTSEYLGYHFVNGVSVTKTKVNFTSSSSIKAESDGSFTIELSITDESSSTATTAKVALLSGNATDIDNYTTQTVTFPAGSNANQTINITITDDSENEGKEIIEFKIQEISGGNSAEAGPNATYSLTITDNDNFRDYGTPLAPTFDKVSADIAIKTYYSSLVGKSGSTLRGAIQSKILENAVVQTYGDAKDILREADINPLNTDELWTIYTESGIDKDAFGASGSSVWNREHIWPQSLGGFSDGTSTSQDGKETAPIAIPDNRDHAHSDAHHLRTSIASENSRRNNNEFDNVNGERTLQSGYYEPPVSAKGDVARAIFYMAVRYNDLSLDNTVSTGDTDRTFSKLSTLLQWHTLDKADDFEMNRNNVVYDWQKNRNPFIDIPELVDYIWGAKQAEEFHFPKEDQTITFNALSSKTYGDANFNLAATSTSGLDITYVSSNTNVATVSGNTITIVGAGSTNITASQAGNGSYNAAADVMQSLTVNKADQTITFNALANKVETDADFTLTATASSGLPIVFTSSNSSVATISSNTVHIVGAGTTTIKASQAGNENFNPAHKDQDQIVTSFVKSDQTITFDDIATKTYGDDDFTLSAHSSSSLEVSYESSDETIAKITGNTVKILKAGNVNIIAKQAGNHEFNPASNVTKPLLIVKTPLTVASNDKSKVYGEANPVLDGSVTGAKNGDVITATYSTTATVSSDVNTYTISISVTGDNLENYEITKDEGELSIEKAPLTIAASNKTKVYGEDNPVLDGTISETKNGDIITARYSTVATKLSDVGKYQIAFVVDGEKRSNYNLIMTEGELEITKAPLTITAADKSREYGDSNPTLDGTITGIKNSDIITATYSTTAIKTSNIGKYSISIVPAGDKLANYEVTKNEGELEITKAPLMVYSNPKTKVYGEANPVLDGYATGIKNNDAFTFEYSTMANESSDVDDYTIDISITSFKLFNYQYTRNESKLTITKAPLTITANNKSKVYGSANPALDGTVSTTKNGDVITATYNTVADETSDVGKYDITIVASGAKLGNYELTKTEGELDVTKATLSITPNNDSRKYGENNPAFTGNITGILNSDDISATYSTTATITSDAGVYDINAVASGSKKANYDITLNKGILTVNKADQNITFSAIENKEYNAVFSLNATSNSGLPISYVSSNTSVATISDNQVTVVGVGTTEITATQSGNINYKSAEEKQNLTTEKATQIITFNSLPNKSETDVPFELTASSNSGLPITYSSSDTDVISIVGTTATIEGAGTSTITASQAGNENYKPASKDQDQAISSLVKTDQSITFNDIDDKTYGDADFNLTATATSGIEVTFISSNDAIAKVTGNKITILKAGKVNIIAKQTGDKFYNPANNVVKELNILKAPLTITANNKSRVYGDANPTLDGTVSATKNGDIITATYSTLATKTSNIGNYTISIAATGEKLENYEVTKTEGDLEITKAPLTVYSNPKTKVYGEANPVLDGYATGIKNNDAFTFEYSTIANENSNVGDYTIDIGIISFKLFNYQYTRNESKLTITKAPLTITANAKSKVYGDANPVLDGTISATKNSDVITATYNTLADEISDVGNYNITIEADGDKLANYELTKVEAELEITKAPLSITANDKSKVYGEANPILDGTVVGVKNNDPLSVEYSTIADKSSDVGDYAITIEATGDKLANYEVTKTEAELEITKAALTIAANDKSKVYGDENPVLDGTVSTTKNSDVITATYSTTADKTSDVGTYAITIEVAGDKLANYEVTKTEAELEITKAPLTIAANDKSKVYGDDNPVLDGTISATKNGDVITATYSTTADKTSDVGTYAITIEVAGDKLSNYEITETEAELQITKAPLSITANAKSKVYGDANPVLDGTISETKNSDVITATYSTLADETSEVGFYDITIEVAGDKKENYNITVEQSRLTVKQAPLNVSSTDATMTYGSEVPVLSGMIEGIRNNDAISVDYSCDATSGSDIGKYVITATETGDKLSNYAVNKTEGYLTITPAQITIVIDNKERVYGDENPLFTGEITGVVNNDDIDVTYNSVANADSDAGDYVITATTSGDKSDNYEIKVTTGTLTVHKAKQIVTVEDIAEYTYGDVNINLEVKGKNSSTVIESSDENIVSTNDGSVKILSAGTVNLTVYNPGDKNHFASEKVIKSVVINKKDLTVTAENVTISYGDDLPEFTFTIDGFVNNEDASVLTASPVANSDISQTPDAGNYENSIVVSGGTADNYSFTYVNGNITVEKADQIITFESITNAHVNDVVVLNATSTSGLDLTYELSNNKASLEGNKLTFTEVGEIIVKAVQAGNNNYNEAIESQTIDIEKATSIGDNFAELVKVFPNPASDYISLNIKDSKTLKITILNSSGRIISNFYNESNEKIDVRSYSPGVYFIIIKTPESTIRKRFIVK